MRAAVLHEYGRPLELAERPVPEPARPSDVLVRVAGAGVCATDLHAIDGLMEPAGVSLPLVLGHIALQLLRELGSSTTIAVDTDGRRRCLAAELGADEVTGDRPAVAAVREATHGRGADIVLDFVGTDQTHADGLAMLARAGTYSIVGYGGTVSVPSAAMVVGEHAVAGNLVGSWIDLWELMELHGRGRIRLVTETHPLEAVNDVLASLREGDVTGRAVLVPTH